MMTRVPSSFHRVSKGANWLAFLALFFSLGTAAETARADEATSSNEKVVRDFIAAWSQLDSGVLVDYFTEDGTYHNMMLEPVSGREALIEFINGFLSNLRETQWDVIHLVAEGNLVMAERVDRTRIGDQSVALPCVGVFEMRDGKIHVWRDYFDLATYTKAFESPPPEE